MRARARAYSHTYKCALAGKAQTAPTTKLVMPAAAPSHPARRTWPIASRVKMVARGPRTSYRSENTSQPDSPPACAAWHGGLWQRRTTTLRRSQAWRRRVKPRGLPRTTHMQTAGACLGGSSASKPLEAPWPRGWVAWLVMLL